MKTSSSKSPYKKALLTSKGKRCELSIAASDRTHLTVTIFATSEKVSKKI